MKTTFWDLLPGQLLTAPGRARNQYRILAKSEHTISLERVADGFRHEMDPVILLAWINRGGEK